MATKLRLGADGEDVRRVQYRLIALGFDISESEKTRQFFGSATANAARAFQQSRGLPTTGAFDRDTEISLGSALVEAGHYFVRGRVAREDDTAVVGVLVQASDIDFRSEEMLGRAETNQDGRYEIAYTAKQFRRAEKDRADLVLRVRRAGNDESIAESATVFNAPADHVVDLRVKRERDPGLSEFERCLAEIRALAGSVSPALFDDKDKEFLAGENRVLAQRIELIAVAHQHERATRIEAVAYYGLLRQQLPRDLFALLLSPASRLKSALLASVRAGIIPRAVETDAEGLVDRLVEARAALAFTGPNRPVLGELLDTANVSAELKRSFLKLRADHVGDAESFWKRISNLNIFTEAQVEELRFTCQIAQLAKLNAPLVKALKPRVTRAHELAAFSDDDWRQSLREVEVPDEVEGANAAERLDRYVDLISESVRKAFPTAHVRQGILTDQRLVPAVRSDLLRLLDSSLDFDIRSTVVERFFVEHPEHVERLENRDGAKIELQRLQRTFRLVPGVPRYEHMRALVEQGFDSCFRIVRTPKKQLYKILAPMVGGEGAADEVVTNAHQHGAYLLQIAGALHDKRWQTNPLVTGGETNVGQSQEPMSNWRTLFGALDFCSCEDCKSVYGPAAYFVELMEFVRKSDKAFQGLMQRRPDLQRIVLNCANTNTVLPVIDLVNEILEAYVAFEGELSAAPALQTTGKVEELGVTPEYTNDDAYTILSNAAFANILPFHRPIEITRTYLEHAGTSLYSLLRTFKVNSVEEEVVDLGLACELLKISHDWSGSNTPEGFLSELAILDGTSGKATRELFGYASESHEAWVRDPETGELVKMLEPWFVNLSRIAELMRRTGLVSDEVVALVQTRFLNPAQPSANDLGVAPSAIVLFSADGVCDVDRTWMQPVDGQHLGDIDTLTPETAIQASEWGRIHRFLRLRHRLGWSINELDLALATFGVADVTSDLMVRLAAASRLRKETEFPLPQLLAFWGDLDTFGEKTSTYGQIFLNRAVSSGSQNPGLALEFLDNGVDTMEMHEAALLAGLRLSAVDLVLLQQHLGLSAPSPLTLKAVSALYRYSALGRLLRLRARDLLALLAMHGGDVFSSPPATCVFANIAYRVDATQFTIRELDYILRHVAEPGQGAVPSDARVIEGLDALKSTLQRIAEDTVLQPDPAGEALRARLEAFVTQRTASVQASASDAAAVVDGLVAVIEGTSEDELDERKGTLSLWFGSLARYFETPDYIESLSAEIASDPQNLDAELSERNDRRAYVLAALLAQVRSMESRSAVKQMLANALTLNPLTVRLLVEGLPELGEPAGLTSRYDSNRPAIDDFLDLVRQDVGAEARAPDYVRLHKVALLLIRFDAAPEDLKFILQHPEAFESIDLNELPTVTDFVVGPTSPAAIRFKWWLALCTYFDVRARLPQGVNGAQRILAAASDEEAKSAFASSTGIATQELAELLEQDGLGLAAGAIRTPSGLLRIIDALDLARRVGVSATKLAQLAKSRPNVQKARDFIGALKAKYDDVQWLAVATPINDALRDKQRDALVAYVLTLPVFTQRSITNVDQLFEYFLIDMAMEPCLKTSRIKQAISSVQTFVQRCFLNLEKGVAPDDLDAEHWKWMRAYRLWEANRKIFLYPENWCVPSLRDDRTPFFKDMEKKLLEGELSEPNVELAVTEYLEKLNDVARLDVVGIAPILENRSRKAVGRGAGVFKYPFYCGDRMSIFGRSPNPPYTYYHRIYDRLQGGFGSWEKVPVDIEGDHLVPAYWDRRLYVFWLLCRPVGNLQETEALPEEEPVQDLEISLAWTEYFNGRWSPRKKSAQKVVSPARIESKNFGSNSASFYLPDPRAHQVRIQAFRQALRISIRRRLNNEMTLELVGSSDPRLAVDLESSFVLPNCQGAVRTASLLETFPPVPDDCVRGAWMGDESCESQDAVEVPLGLDWVAILRNTVTANGAPPRGKYVFLAPATADEDGPGGIFPIPFGFQDDSRVYLVTADTSQTDVDWFAFDIGSAGGSQTASYRSSGNVLWVSAGLLDGFDTQPMVRPPLKFHAFFHPHLCTFIAELHSRGVDSLLAPTLQKLTNEAPGPLDGQDTVFWKTYAPNEKIVDPEGPLENVDFRAGAAYSVYNWELFFHLPMYIADRLSAEKRHEEAHRYYHYIFNPTLGAKETWRFIPFSKAQATAPEQLMALLHGSDNESKKQLRIDIAAWRDDPFNPWRIARSTLRTDALMKMTVMKYIANVVAWADDLYERDTMESINEATQLYIYAANILGPKPAKLPPHFEPKELAYQDMDFDEFGNAWLELENAFPFSSKVTTEGGSGSGQVLLDSVMSFYFCIPPNDKLLSYWSLVEDRLFKIRHCMNIEGVARELPLFEPPIDPALLVQAAAAGLDLSSVLNDVYGPTPRVRFPVALRRALEVCSEAKACSAAMLSAWEKGEAEVLAAVRASHETDVLARVRDVKSDALKEAEASLAALEATRAPVQERYNFYSTAAEWIEGEIAQATLLVAAGTFRIAAQLSAVAGAALAVSDPDKYVIAAGMVSGTAAQVQGGVKSNAAAQGFADAFNCLATAADTGAQLVGLASSNRRRFNEYQLQARSAAKELQQIDKQMIAARIRIEMAVKELANTEQQIEQAKEVEEHLRTKFSSAELYGWMQGECSALSFQAWKMAYELAKKAERCFRFEHGVSSSNFIQFGYWDSAKKGLFAAEKLYLDLKRMETAYLEASRDLELSKSVSLLKVDPVALLMLRSTGECSIRLHESLYDRDFPSHYMRRIKNLSLSVPHVTGPYTGLYATLSLMSSEVRTKPERTEGPDDPVEQTFGAIQSIATSTGQNDSGGIELNTNGEQRFPFEGAGAAAELRLSMPLESNTFDYRTITDVVLHLRYSAREGGATLAAKTVSSLKSVADDGYPLALSMSREFSGRWHEFFAPAVATGDMMLRFDLTRDVFPYMPEHQRPLVLGMDVYIELRRDISVSNLLVGLTCPAPSATEPGAVFSGVLIGTSLAVASLFPGSEDPFVTQQGLGSYEVTISAQSLQELPIGPLVQEVTNGSNVHRRLNPEVVRDLWVVLRYRAQTVN